MDEEASAARYDIDDPQQQQQQRHVQLQQPRSDASADSREDDDDGEMKLPFVNEPFLPDEMDQCPVCSDRVSGYHYGLQTCESCKGFFKRTVQNQKKYVCLENQNCVIDKAHRKRCPYCRFQKCLQVGMKLEAVRENRTRGGRNKFGPIYRRDRALRRQLMCQRLSAEQASASMYLPNLDSEFYPADFSFMSEEVDIKPNVSDLLPFTSSMGSTRTTAESFRPSTACTSRTEGYNGPPHISTWTQALPYQTWRWSAESRGANPLSQMSTLASSFDEPFVIQRDRPLLGDDQSRAYFSEAAPTGHRHAYHVGPVPISQHSLPAASYMPRYEHEAARQGTGSSWSTVMLPHHSATHAQPSASKNLCHLQSGMHSAQEDSSGKLLSSDKTTTSLAITPSTSQPVAPRQTSLEQLVNFCAAPSATVTSATESSADTGISDADLAACRIPAALQLIVDLQKNDAKSIEQLRQFAEDVTSQIQRCRSSEAAAHDDALVTKDMVQIMCQLCDQALFILVEWARRAHFFRQLPVDDQMKLLENCWSELLLLDMLYKQLEHTHTQQFLMVTGHMVMLDVLVRIGLGGLCNEIVELVRRIRNLKLDSNEYTCLKFVILLNPDVPGLSDASVVEHFRSEVNSALLDYCCLLSLSEETAIVDKFGRMLLELSEIKLLSLRLEEYLFQQHLTGNISNGSLLAEMLLASRQ